MPECCQLFPVSSILFPILVISYALTTIYINESFAPQGDTVRWHLKEPKGFSCLCKFIFYMQSQILPPQPCLTLGFHDLIPRTCEYVSSQVRGFFTHDLAVGRISYVIQLAKRISRLLWSEGQNCDFLNNSQRDAMSLALEWRDTSQRMLPTSRCNKEKRERHHSENKKVWHTELGRVKPTLGILPPNPRKESMLLGNTSIVNDCCGSNRTLHSSFLHY